MPEAIKPSTKGSQRFEALDALRGVAVLMVVYDHLFAVAGERLAGGVFAPVPWVRQWVSGPMGVIQDFGWFGVCLFFLISGFVIAHAARRERVQVFVVRRLLRIFPPLAAAVAVVAALDFAAGQTKNAWDYLLGVSLLGYLVVPQVIVLGVAWTLVIEVVFYGLIAVLSPLLKSRFPALALLLGMGAVLLTQIFARDFGANVFLFAASAAYLPILFIGSSLYLFRVSAINGLTALLLVLANYAIFMLGLRTVHTDFLPIQNSYLVSATYALAVFWLCLEWRAPAVLKRVGDVSYSLYLLHGSLGFFFVQVLWSAGAGVASPLLATLACLLASFGFYRVIERPSMALGKRLSI